MKNNEIVEEDTKKGIIIISIAIAVVIGLIVLTAHLSNNAFEEETPSSINDKTEVKKDEDLTEREVSNNSLIATVSNKIYIVRYLDIDGEQLGKTQRLLSLNDRINEKAPKIDGMRFVEWVHSYDENEDIHYYIASYRENVEVVTKEVKVTYKKTPTVTSTIIPVENEELESSTYDVIIEGEVPETELTEDVTISEEYEHVIALRFYAPEDVTEKDIENMSINVYATDENEIINEDQYSYNGEDTTKKGRELLDSTDEEYANGIYYFDYYQETETSTNTTVEVYWGNDHNANETTPPQSEYIEVYNIDLDNVENKKEDGKEQVE